jgi:hypothetical protein
MSYTIHYHITNDSLRVNKIGGLPGENTVILLHDKMSASEADRLFNIVTADEFKNLKTEYKNPLISDGDQKRIIVEVKGQKKEINIANVYNEDIAKLIACVNMLLTEKFKIRYAKPGE